MTNRRENNRSILKTLDGSLKAVMRLNGVKYKQKQIEQLKH